MNAAEAQALVNAIASWAIDCRDIRAVAPAGSWARAQQESDIDFLLLCDRCDAYRRRPEWLTTIDFAGAGYGLQSSKTASYGAIWSQRIQLSPTADVELTFADPSWAEIDPVDPGTRHVVRDASRVILEIKSRCRFIKNETAPALTPGPFLRVAVGRARRTAEAITRLRCRSRRRSRRGPRRRRP